MKKMLLLAVAVAFASTAWAETKTVKIKEETKGDKEKITITEKQAGEKEKIKITEQGSTVTATDTVKMKKGEVAKDTVKFEKYEANGDYIYVMKENKVIRLKHKLDDSMKKNMLSLKKGDTVTVTSTHPLTNADIAIITGIESKK